jgi:hypothetical protein
MASPMASLDISGRVSSNSNNISKTLVAVELLTDMLPLISKVSIIDTKYSIIKNIMVFAFCQKEVWRI